MKRPGLLRKVLSFVAYNLVAAGILLFTMELAVRFFVRGMTASGTSKAIIADSLYYSTHGLKPSSSGVTNGAPVEVDRFGFRRNSIAADTSKPSWLLLGDSVTFGIGVAGDSTFAGILQSKMDSINVLNPSASGNNLNSYWDVFRCFVFDKRHNFTIYRVSVFWCLNDVYANVPDFEVPGGKLHSMFSDGLTFVRVQSRLYHFLKTLFFDRPRSYFLFDKSFYRSQQPGFLSAVETIAGMNRLCRERNIAFEVVLLPYEYQLREADFAPQRLLRRMLREQKVRVLDPFEEVSGKNPQSKPYFLYGDGIHLSNRGHRSIADFLMKPPFKPGLPGLHSGL